MIISAPRQVGTLVPAGDHQYSIQATSMVYIPVFMGCYLPGQLLNINPTAETSQADNLEIWRKSPETATEETWIIISDVGKGHIKGYTR